jgi:uncharacterized membrane protein YeiH
LSALLTCCWVLSTGVGWNRGDCRGGSGSERGSPVSLLAIAAASTTAAAGSAVATLPAAAGLASMITTAAQGFVASTLPSVATTTAPVTSVAAQVPPAFEITATFAGALAGALVGVRLRFDLVGVLTLAVISGLGGGIIRDVLLNTEVYALQNPRLLAAALGAALVVFFFFSVADRLQWSLFLIDAISLGIFAAIGSDKALLAGLAIIPALLLGTITAIGGGLLRDVLTNDVPQVLRPGGFYASVAVAGCITYVSLVSWLNVVKPLALVLTVLLVLVLRLVTHWLGWQTPTATDLTPLVASAPPKAVETGGRAWGWAKRTTRLDQRGGDGEPPRDADSGDEQAPKP